MQKNSNSLKVKTWLIVFIFLSSAGLGYSVVNQFVFDKPNTSLLLIFGSLFVAAIAALQRNKYQNLK